MTLPASVHTELWEYYVKNIGKGGTFDSANQLFETVWSWRMIHWPEYASFCGCHDFDDRLNSRSLEVLEAKEEVAKDFLEHCRKLLDIGDLSDADFFNLVLLREELRLFTEGAEHKGYLFAICYMEGLQVDFEQIKSWMVFETVNDYEIYIKRMQAISPRVDQDVDLMKEGIRLKKTYHITSMRGVLPSIDAIINVDNPEATVMYQPFVTMPDEISEEEKQQLRDKALQVIEGEVIPAFVYLRVFIENEYMPNCREEEGITTVPDGKEFYQQCLRFHLSLDVSPDDIYELGRAEVFRIQQEMKEVMENLGFKGKIRDFVQHLRTHTEFYFEDQESLLEAFRDIAYNKIRPRLDKLFKNIPESELTIELVPESRAEGSAFYMAGTQDGSRPGIFYVNAHSMQLSPSYQMMSLTLHEGEPGHHFQGMYAIEMESAPEFRKNVEDMIYGMAPSRFSINTAYVEIMRAINTKERPSFRRYIDGSLNMVPSQFPQKTAYVEGWGLYCEYLGKELGLYDDDLYSLFGHLSDEMHRACRLVVDTGIHAFGWSFEKAELMMLENTALAEEDIRNEIKRYITWPGQALGYKVGQLKIMELRSRCEEALGENFDVKDFHDLLLRCGAVPLTVLETVVNKYIEQEE